MRKLKTDVYDFSFRCHTCKICVVRRERLAEATDLIDESALSEKAPRCPRCRKKMSYYWAWGWFKAPAGYS